MAKKSKKKEDEQKKVIDGSSDGSDPLSQHHDLFSGT